MENALHGQSHDDGEVETPQIEAEIAAVTNPLEVARAAGNGA